MRLGPRAPHGVTMFRLTAASEAEGRASSQVTVARGTVTAP